MTATCDAMRLLLTTLPLVGHVRAMLPVAQAIRRAGHDALLCGPASLEPVVGGTGVPMLATAGTGQIARRLRDLADHGDLASGDADRFIEELTTEILPYQVVPDEMAAVEDAVARWRPDVIVRDCCDFGALLEGELLGIPSVSVATVSGAADFLHPAITAALNARRREYGLAEDNSGERAYALLHANLTPPWLDDGELRVPNARFYRYAPPASHRDMLPDWVVSMPAHRPVVYLSFGTMVTNFRVLRPVIEMIIEALSGADVSLVVSGSGLPELYGGKVPEAIVVPEVCQWLMLECADLFITHGGFNSVREALGAGVPMIGIPTNPEAAHTISCCTKIGCATILDWRDMTVQAVRSACAQALGSASRQAARHAAMRMRALPPLDVLVQEISDSIRTKGSGVVDNILGVGHPGA